MCADASDASWLIKRPSLFEDCSGSRTKSCTSPLSPSLCCYPWAFSPSLQRCRPCLHCFLCRGPRCRRRGRQVYSKGCCGYCVLYSDFVVVVSVVFCSFFRLCCKFVVFQIFSVQVMFCFRHRCCRLTSVIVVLALLLALVTNTVPLQEVALSALGLCW